MTMRIAPTLFAFATTLAPRSIIATSNNASAFVTSSGTSRILHTQTTTTAASMSSIASSSFDAESPGTAVVRLESARQRVKELVDRDELSNAPWEDIRRKLLWAGGLRDLPNATPGQGYTGHCFNDWNHVDLTPIADDVSNNQNEGHVPGIARGNLLGPGIRIASLPELGPGGSWTTCAAQDVAGLQFKARIAFRLVWVPNHVFDEFVLVDDRGKLLAHGTNITEGLPLLMERQMNYRMVAGTKFAKEADRIATVATE
ncbi:hypothetical protein MPSEU_000796000 [Mayamaea pseudoterrestris]|nr:hypothetical protein MPSEU_000796000 [Mayamaea pseudoterrestris]